MNITINHYEPHASQPYDVEEFQNITDFVYDTQNKNIRFVLENGKIYTAVYVHPIIIDIQTK